MTLLYDVFEWTLLATKFDVWQGLDYPYTARHWLLESAITEHNKWKVNLKWIST